MRKELTKLKEELIDGECVNKFGNPAESCVIRIASFKKMQIKKP